MPPRLRPCLGDLWGGWAAKLLGRVSELLISSARLSATPKRKTWLWLLVGPHLLLLLPPPLPPRLLLPLDDRTSIGMTEFFSNLMSNAQSNQHQTLNEDDAGAERTYIIVDKEGKSHPQNGSDPIPLNHELSLIHI